MCPVRPHPESLATLIPANPPQRAPVRGE